MRLAARLSPTRVAMATVMTRPPIISGIHISAPVRAVVPLMVELWVDPVDPVEPLEPLELFVLLVELCALATPARVNVMTKARKAAARTLRTTDPVVRTFPTLPK